MCQDKSCYKSYFNDKFYTTPCLVWFGMVWFGITLKIGYTSKKCAKTKVAVNQISAINSTLHLIWFGLVWFV